MNLFDVNVLIYAHRSDTQSHSSVRRWFEREMSGPSSFMMSELVLSNFVRIVTNPRVFKVPTPLGIVLREVEQIRENPLCLTVNPGKRHFDLFLRLCRQGDAKGNLVTDAYLAALAIENGCRWCTFDRDYARFPGLDWAEPDLSAA
jgi:toxin-antitoxin system PIN domain toxin